MINLFLLLPHPTKYQRESYLASLRPCTPKGYMSDKAKNQLSCDKHYSFLSGEGGIRRIRESKLNCFAHKYVCVWLVCYKRDCLWAVLCANCLGNCVLLLLYFIPFLPCLWFIVACMIQLWGVCVRVLFIYLFICLLIQLLLFTLFTP